MQFEPDLEDQLFALFIAYSNSAHFNKMGGPNTEQGLAYIIYLVSTEYQNFWLDRSYHEPFYSEVIRIVKESANK